jgi:hypothetical protein
MAVTGYPARINPCSFELMAHYPGTGGVLAEVDNYKKKADKTRVLSASHQASAAPPKRRRARAYKPLV